MSIFKELSRKQNRKGRPPIRESENLREDFEEFENWFEEEIVPARWDGYQPDNLERFFESSQDCHLALRRRLGGINRVINHELQAMQKKVSAHVIKPIYDELSQHISLEFNKAGMKVSLDDMCHPYGGPKGMKITKFIAQQKEKERFLGPEGHKKVGQLMEKLGQKWADARTEKKTVYSNLDTSTKAFLSLARYNVDDVSCWKQGGPHEQDKFKLAETDNTFVLIIRKDEHFSYNQEYQGTVCARMWGFHRPLNKTVNFCNLYVGDQFLRGNALEICRQQSAHLLKADLDDVKFIDDALEVKRVYHNEDAQNWTFYVGDEVPQTQKI